jgi:hypothetical protein
MQVGRVEATIRKVALAACYGLLKAGAVEMKVMHCNYLSHDETRSSLFV